MAERWERRAAEWLAWARTPGHDAYWRYRDAFSELLPRPAGGALDLGCGEGRVTRDLSERGYRVTALDASPSLVAAAGDCDSSSHYVVGDADALPVADETFDLVVAYNVLTDVDDMPAVVAEAAGLVIDSVREPSEPSTRRAHPPMFLMLRCRKLSSPPANAG